MQMKFADVEYLNISMVKILNITYFFSADVRCFGVGHQTMPFSNMLFMSKLDCLEGATGKVKPVFKLNAGIAFKIKIKFINFQIFFSKKLTKF